MEGDRKIGSHRITDWKKIHDDDVRKTKKHRSGSETAA